MTKKATLTQNIDGWNFDNSYLLLPTSLYVRQKPVPVPKPRLVVFNHTLAQSLGLNSQFLAESDAAIYFSGNRLLAGSEPIAQAYAGHQFGRFTMLGDGRAILLGEQITPDGKRFDIQLKGAGQTPYSRAGDGRAALGPMLREYIISEAMHALGIPTTRSLAVVTTGQPVIRESILPGAILTRVAASHIRVGTFEYAAALGNTEELKSLADYTLQRHYPELLEDENPYLALLHAAMERQAALVAQWQLFGFIHGVMNTDNMALSGETIDYGPCAFMDTYDPATVFSSIDYHGRYAYGNQPKIAQWNVARLTEALLPLLHSKQEKSLEMGQAALATFSDIFKKYWVAGMREKLGLFTQEADDISLIESLLVWMSKNQTDFTNTFHSIASDTLTALPFFQREGFKDWHDRWQARLLRQSNPIHAVKQLMRTKNPSVIPRNHQVEEALKAAVEQDDFSKMHKLLAVLATPYADLPGQADYQHPPEHSDTEYKTFCGT